MNVQTHFYCILALLHFFAGCLDFSFCSFPYFHFFHFFVLSDLQFYLLLKRFGLKHLATLSKDDATDGGGCRQEEAVHNRPVLKSVPAEGLRVWVDGWADAASKDPLLLKQITLFGKYTGNTTARDARRNVFLSGFLGFQKNVVCLLGWGRVSGLCLAGSAGCGRMRTRPIITQGGEGAPPAAQ